MFSIEEIEARIAVSSDTDAAMLRQLLDELNFLRSGISKLIGRVP